MRRNTSGLKRGGPGRRRGIPNRTTVAIKVASRALVEDEKGFKALLTKYRKGTLHPTLVQMFFHYAYGKPKETVSLEGADGTPLTFTLTLDRPTTVVDTRVALALPVNGNGNGHHA